MLALTAAVGLLSAACSPAPVAAAHPSATAVRSPLPPAAGKCPLTDLNPPSGVSVDRPVLAVKIDDIVPNAEPQSGLGHADVVYDEPVAPGVGRFLALFQCGNPPRIGPVRGVDPADAAILAQYGSSLLASAGGPAAVLQSLQATPGIVNADSLVAGAAYSRDSTRKAPYNLYVDPQALRSADAAAAGGVLRAPEAQFRFAQAGQPSPAASPETSSVTFVLGPQIAYRYDAQANGYLRFENGQPQVGASGSQILVSNVVIMWTQMGPAGTAGNATPDPDVVGQGDALVLTGGREYDGTWSRPHEGSRTTFVDSSGVIPLTPGTTWIHLLPTEERAIVS